MVRKANAMLSALDAGILQGVGLFETIGVASGVPLFLAEHIGRMRRSAHFFGIQPRWSWGRIARCVPAVIRRNRMFSGIVRVTLTGGLRARMKDGRDGARLVVAMRPGRPLPPTAHSNGIGLLSAPWLRSGDCPLLRHKTTSYFENILGQEYARERGAFDVVFCDSRGRLLEGSVSNIFVVCGRRVLTPSARLPILPGITRAVVLGLCRHAGLPARASILRKGVARRAEEMFVTNAVIGVLPVTRFDGRRVGSGAVGQVTKRLVAAYEKEVLEQIRVFGRRSRNG
jgi:branched-subunit amino acid aminotransferase/4-amino-4-deoxychorismate lyase